jgi:phage terminase small subunit
LIVKTQSGGAAVNPPVQIANRAALDMARIGSEFRLSPSARARIANGGSWFRRASESKFHGLIGGLGTDDEPGLNPT